MHYTNSLVSVSVLEVREDEFDDDQGVLDNPEPTQSRLLLTPGIMSTFVDSENLQRFDCLLVSVVHRVSLE